jgi:iron complex transport system permease protein|tara:strand:- start:9767 stop:10741 length:975 start_codon:yes stop_codon:yes gene_type:complete
VKLWLWAGLLVFVWAMAFVLSLVSGYTSLNFGDVWQPGSLTQTVVGEVRLPRAILATLLGGGLALAGAGIQGVFRNPLADPALIGISGGAALFAAVYIVFVSQTGFSLLGLSGSAFLGGVIATLLVLLIGGRQPDLSTILLAGIAINAICLAGVGLMSYLAPDQTLRSVSFWALGSFNHVGWPEVSVGFLVIPAMIRLIALSLVLDVLTLGDREAAHLGISVIPRRIEVILWSALITGISVSLVGIIAFVGLIVPHLVRISFSAKHVVVLPFSAIIGGGLMVAADLFSRSLLAPVELPVGIVITLLGAPIFVVLVARWSKGLWL